MQAANPALAMTPATFAALPKPSVADLRFLLLCAFNITEAFEGDGWIYDDDNNRVAREWLAQNVPMEVGKAVALAHVPAAVVNCVLTLRPTTLPASGDNPSPPPPAPPVATSAPAGSKRPARPAMNVIDAETPKQTSVSMVVVAASVAFFITCGVAVFQRVTRKT